MISKPLKLAGSLSAMCIALGIAQGLGCVRVIPGVQLSLKVEIAQPDALNSQGEAIYLSPEGGELHLASGYLNISAWEVLPCATAGLQFPRLTSVAQAHTQGSPTQWGTPQAIDLRDVGGEALSLGTIEPPPGSWCSILLYLSPADGDGLGLPPGGSMTGQTFTLAGTFGPQGAGDTTPFEIESDISNLIILPLGDGGLTFDEASPWGEATLRIDPGQLFQPLEGGESREDVKALAEQNLTRFVTLSDAQIVSASVPRPPADAP